MLMLRPWIRMNKYRITTHHVVFFIFIVSNVGGCLTPIGDPPWRFSLLAQRKSALILPLTSPTATPSASLWFVPDRAARAANRIQAAAEVRDS